MTFEICVCGFIIISKHGYVEHVHPYTQHVHRGQKTPCRNWLSPRSVWAMTLKLRLLGLAACPPPLSRIASPKRVGLIWGDLKDANFQKRSPCY